MAFSTILSRKWNRVDVGDCQVQRKIATHQGRASKLLMELEAERISKSNETVAAELKADSSIICSTFELRGGTDD